MLDLNRIRDILDFARMQRKETPNYMEKEDDEACRLLVEAIDEGRVQIVKQVP